MPNDTPLRLKAIPTQDGAGVKIRRISDFNGRLDPFLLIDELKSEVQEDYVGGFPPHPHRGFETLTYLLKGGLQHEDSRGHRGEVTRGGAQWMRAGRGVIHSEMPLKDGNGLHGFQIWINLPAEKKMSEPAYRDIQSDDIPEMDINGGHARLIAGKWQLNDVQGAGALAVLGDGAGIADLTVNAHADVDITLPEGYRLLAYVYEGELKNHAAIGELAVFVPEQSTINLHAETDTGILLMAGRPLREPIVHHGPFVMNTIEEIEQAINDYQTDVMG